MRVSVFDIRTHAAIYTLEVQPGQLVVVVEELFVLFDRIHRHPLDDGLYFFVQLRLWVEGKTINFLQDLSGAKYLDSLSHFDAA